MTQEVFEPPHVCNIKKDLIDDLDGFTFDIRQRAVYYIRHFTGNKYCIICDHVLRISEHDDNDDFDIHMNNDHTDHAIITTYLEILKEVMEIVTIPLMPV